jgi:hypothetical protein
MMVEGSKAGIMCATGLGKVEGLGKGTERVTCGESKGVKWRLEKVLGYKRRLQEV